MQYINSEILSKFKNQYILAKTIVDGLYQGIHFGHRFGQSLEFQEYREYTTYDDLKNVDWKLYGKTDKLFVKKYKQEANLSCYLILDISNSMKFKYKSDILKIDYAKSIISILSYLFLKQNDKVSFLSFNDKIRDYIPLGTGTKHLFNITGHLNKVNPEGQTNIPDTINFILNKFKSRSIIIFVSDFYNDIVPSIKYLKQLKSRNNDLVIIRVLDTFEENIKINYPVKFIDSETREEIIIHPKKYSKQYSSLLTDTNNYISKNLKESNIDYWYFNTETNLYEILLKYIGLLNTKNKHK